MKCFSIRRFCKAAMLGSLLSVSVSVAEGVDVFGYFQTLMSYQNSTLVKGEPSRQSYTFSLPEVDLFLQKDLGNNFSCLIDIQMINNFSSAKQWGSIGIDEAWLKYRHSQYLQVKAGRINPIFNNFNEIKTKFPLMPYLSRPAVYESSLDNMFPQNQYIPGYAALQLNGTVPVRALKADYAVFFGNSEFISNETNAKNGFVLSGTDSTKLKAVGGRVGIRIAGLKLGVSGTYDYTRNDDLETYLTNVNFIKGQSALNTPMIPIMTGDTISLLELGGSTNSLLDKIGPVARSRFGTDLSYTGFGFTLETEFILVQQHPTSTQEAQLAELSEATRLFKWAEDAGAKAAVMNIGAILPASSFAAAMGKDLKKTFFYANLSYDFTEKYFAYVGYSNVKNNCELMATSQGVDLTSIGGGVRLNDNATLKVQVTDVRNPDEMEYRAQSTMVYTGLSVAF